MTHRIVLKLACLVAPFAFGCGASVAAETPVRSTPPHADQRSGFTPGTASAGGAETRACSSGSVFFAVDSSTLDHAALDQLECIPKGARLNVVGLADPRGTEEYNLALGERRARAVADHLARIGHDREAIATRSLGEETATGTSDLEWARDRRADFVAP